MVLKIDNLTKVYQRRVKANDGISLEVQEGEILGLLGHNGAGKTTLLNQVAGLVRPTSGSIRLDGRDVVADPAFARRACSFQLQAQAPLTGVSPRQAIEIVGRIRGGDSKRVRRRTTELLEALEITEWQRMPGEKVSGGVRRLTAFAMAAVEPGRLVMLDEPTNDVDPIRRRLLWQQVRALAAGGAAVVVVTHNIAEAERTVDRAVVLDSGQIVSAGTPAELRGHISGDLRLELTLTPGQAAPPMPDFAGPTRSDGLRLITSLATADVHAAVKWALELRDAGIVQEVAVNPISLEDVYVHLIENREATTNAALGA